MLEKRKNNEKRKQIVDLINSCAENMYDECGKR